MAILANAYAIYHEHSAAVTGLDYDILEFDHRDYQPDGSCTFDGWFPEQVEGENVQPFLQGRYDDAAHTILIQNTGYMGRDIPEHIVYTGRTITATGTDSQGRPLEYVGAMTGTYHRITNIDLETGEEGVPPPSDPFGVWSTWDTYLGVWAAAYNPTEAAALEREAEFEERAEESRHTRVIFVPRRP
jgi:hypothetical protein